MPSKVLGISHTTVWRLWKNGIIPRIKGTVYYDLREVEKALNNRTQFNKIRGQNL